MPSLRPRSLVLSSALTVIYSAVIYSATFYSTVLYSNDLFAQGLPVDEADGLDFEAFHEKSNDSIKIWDRFKPKKAYEDKTQSQTTAPVSEIPQQGAIESKTPASRPIQSIDAPEASQAKGTRYDIRQDYSLQTDFSNASQSVGSAITLLHQQMATLCPKGWSKLSERSVPAGNGFYLHYELECL